MIEIRKSHDRGIAEHGWLHSKHTFSFADYHDPKHMGFGVLRVINEDRIEGGTGFGTHPHRDMEIISYVIDGALEHQDSMGNKAIIKPGEIQRMSAGTGVRHSEHNHLKDKQTHFLQIWILPKKEGVSPSYDQINFEPRLANSNFILLASSDGRDGSITVNQEVNIYLGKTKLAAKVNFKPVPHAKLWIQVIRGEVRFSDKTISAGDGAATMELPEINFEISTETEFLLFEMPEAQEMVRH